MVSALRALALTAALLLIASALPQAQTRRDLFIPVGPSDSLDAVCFIPFAPPPRSGYPALIMVHGFGDSKEARIPSCEIYSGMGFASFAFSVRGEGKSSGLSSIMSTREREDFRRVLDFVRNYPGIDTSLIGVIGGSQGGLHGLWAIADRLPVKAVAVDAMTTHWASDMLSNGCIRRTLVLLLKHPAVQFAPVRDTLWNMVRRDAYDELAGTFPRGRDLDDADVASAHLPLMQFLKWQDQYFNAAPGIREFSAYAGTKFLYLGTQGHYSDEIGTEQFFQFDHITRWFQQILQGQPSGILTERPITYALSSLPLDTAGNFRWTRDSVSAWPPPGTHPLRLYLGHSHMLTVNGSDRRADSVVIFNRYANHNYTFDTAYIEGFRGKRFDSVIPQSRTEFTTEPLRSDLVWAGVPRMSLFVRSAFPVFPLHAQVYEVDTTGREYFINRINYTARHWRNGTTGKVEVDGIAHAHRFRAGNRIRVVFTNLDRTNRRMWGEYPFVLPVFKNASATVVFDKSHPSFIEIPSPSSGNF